MTDALLPDDELDELASAYLDGVATPAERARVEADPGLLARVDRLAEVRRAVRGLDLTVDHERREATIAAALDALTEAAPPTAAGVVTPTAEAPLDLADRRPPAWSRRRLRYLAVAAAVAVAALAVPLLGRLDTGGDDDMAATVETTGAGADAGEGSAPDAATTAEAGAPLRTSELAAADLGAFDDLEDLADAARRHLQADGGSTDDDVSPTTVGPAAEAMTSTSSAACAGSLEVPADATVLHEATATLAGAPVVVVVYERPGASPQLLVADAADCSTSSLTDL